jgi:hypothetical protein
MILFNYYYYLLRLEAASPSTPFRLAPVIPFTVSQAAVNSLSRWMDIIACADSCLLSSS